MNDQPITPEVLLYGTKPGEIEDLLTSKVENIIFVLTLAKQDGYRNFRIVDYTEQPIEKPDFIGAITH